jgi:hypothetical protein
MQVEEAKEETPRASETGVAPQSGHVSNFCSPVGRVIERMDGFCFHHH